jgi:hypothetical protein
LGKYGKYGRIALDFKDMNGRRNLDVFWRNLDVFWRMIWLLS